MEVFIVYDNDDIHFRPGWAPLLLQHMEKDTAKLGKQQGLPENAVKLIVLLCMPFSQNQPSFYSTLNYGMFLF